MVKVAVVGGGCFWCTEAAFKELEGVLEVTSGYAGGHKDEPSYKEVCSGKTGHAEVVKIKYNESTLKYEDILEVFFKIHDPTTKNKQGPDTGSQYRSIILYKNEQQKDIAERIIKDIDKKGQIVTELEPLDNFYAAEEAHQDYFDKNPDDAYCRINVAPKIEKVKEEFN